MKTLSLTTRISLLFAAAACIVLLTTGYFLARVIDTHFQEVDRHELDGKLELIDNLFKQTSTPEELALLPLQIRDALVGHHGLAVAIIEANGNTWFMTSEAEFPLSMLRMCASNRKACRLNTLQHWTQSGIGHRGKVVRITAATGARFIVGVGLDIGHHEQFMQTFLAILASAIALAATATAGLGWIATRWGLAPLRQVTDKVASISANRLDERLPDTRLPQELQPLAQAFNAMLARLDDSFTRLSEFSSNIAHELRTPISNLMTQTQVALSSARDKDAYKEILYSSLEEYERMAQMVGDMLYLAQTDNGLLRPDLGDVDLVTETRNLFDYFEAWAEERTVALNLSGSATVPGDRLMLRRALSNLLSNAIRHTPAGQSVNVTLASQNTLATVTIENPGPQIPAEHLPRLFDRFYRVDPSRQRKGDGAGLGLAIVKAIIDAHGGTINVTSSEHQTRFQLVMPGSAT